MDLVYFFNTSTTDEFWSRNEDTVLREYLKTLSVTMARSGCRRIAPTLEELKAGMRKRFAYGMITSMVLLPNLLVDQAEAKSIEEMSTGDGSFENPTLKGKLFRETIAKRLPVYDRMGLLD